MAILISNAIFGWWIFTFWTVDLLKSLNSNWQCYLLDSLFDLIFRRPRIFFSWHARRPIQPYTIAWPLDDTHPLTASGWISRCETDTKSTDLQKAWCHDWHAKNNLCKQRPQIGNERKMRWLMQNCLMKDMCVFVAREYVEDTQNGTGESASLSTWSKKSITFKAISQEKSWEKSPTLDLQIDPKDLESSKYTQPIVLAPPKSSHLVSYEQWSKPYLFVVYRRLFRDCFTSHEFRILEPGPIRISFISLTGFVAVAHKVKVALVSRGGLLPQHTPGARALASKAMRDKGRRVGLIR